MFSKLFRRRLDGSRDEAGVAMIVAIIVVMLLTLIPLTVYLQAQQQLPLSRHQQDHQAALAAAEAGVDDYLNRLAQNSNYWVYNAGNLPPDGNQAFTQWTDVPGPSNNNEEFRYAPDTTKTATTGIVYLTSTGRSRNVMRTVKVGVRRQGFLDYLWFTDYELVDPSLSGHPSRCIKHAWEYNTATGSYGPDTGTCPNNNIVWWTSSATLIGPVHSNDGFYVCGSPDFTNANIDTYYNSPTSNNVPNSLQFGGPGDVVDRPSCPATPQVVGNQPNPGTKLDFPPKNDALKLLADKSVGGAGCLYTGPTTIVLNSNGTMNVTSPATKTTSGTLNTPGCTPGNGKPLPANGVIYVQNIPTSGPDASSCSGTGCYGDVNLRGTLRGQLTIAAQNDIVISEDVRYNTWPGGTDVLGLIADNDIAVYHPVSSGGNNLAGSITNLRIDAAMLALNHSFYVQNWNRGAPLGWLEINGVIAQKYRGAVGTFTGNPPVTNHGYDKDYEYDSRLKYLSPPYFLSPVQSAWNRVSFAEIKPIAAP
jgi:Tfp pilus assembly protein PilX